MKYPGQMPVPEFIQAHAQLSERRILVYFNTPVPMIYGEDSDSNICYLKCISGVHHNLIPVSHEIEQVKLI